MSTSFAALLYEAFEKNGATVLLADHFLIVLRRLGATVSAEEGFALIEWLGTDARGCVDVRMFCSWFDGIEEEKRFASSPAHAHASSSALVVPNFAFQETSDLAAVEAWENMAVGQVGGEVGNEINAGGKENAHNDVVEGCRRRLRLPPKQALRFDPNVYADDGDVILLGYAHEDKYTLPSRRKLSEHEKLMASLRSCLNDVKARLESAPIEYRPDVTRNPHVAPV